MDEKALRTSGHIASIVSLVVASAGMVGALTSSQTTASWLGGALVVVGVIVFLAFVLEAVLGGSGTMEPAESGTTSREPTKGSRRLTHWVSRYFTVVAVALILAVLVGAVSFVNIVHENTEIEGSWLQFTAGPTQSKWTNLSGPGQIVFNWTQMTAPGSSPPQVQIQVTGPGHQVMFSGFTNYGYPGYGGIVASAGAYLFNVTTNPSVDTKVYLSVQAVYYTSGPILQV